MPFKGISYLELWLLFCCSAERNHLCNFGRGHYEEQLCEMILNLDQWFRRRCLLRYFLSGALAALLFSEAEIICAILVEGIKRNNSVKLCLIWKSDSGGDVV